MKIEFAEAPTIGTALKIDGRRYDLVRIDPHTRMDGTATSLLIWNGQCADCGVLFSFASPALSLPGNRRCGEHKAPGRKAA